jgi:hypothetical protein
MSLDGGSRGAYIGHGERRISGRLDQDEPDIVGLCYRFGKRPRVARCNGPRHESERLNNLVNQVLGAAIEWLGVYQRAAPFEKPDQDSEDRRHP